MSVPTASPQNQSGSSFLVQGCDRSPLLQGKSLPCLAQERLGNQMQGSLKGHCSCAQDPQVLVSLPTLSKNANTVVKPFVCRAVSGT